MVPNPKWNQVLHISEGGVYLKEISVLRPEPIMIMIKSMYEKSLKLDL